MGAQETDLSDLAGRQHGVITRADLVALGFGRRQVERRVAAGRLLRVHRGVYAVGHRALSREGRWLAAVLACGEAAVLSHRSAAAFWGFADREPPLPHVTAAGRLRVAGVVTHEARLAPADRTVHVGIPVTTPARTLVDLAHGLPDEQFERCVRQAQFERLFHPAAIADALSRRRSRVLQELLDDLNPTQSQLEDAFLRLCRRHGIPAPRAQVRDGRRRPDFVWPDARVVVEVDSWSAHGTPRAFQADRAQSNAAQLAGWVLLRFTWADVTRRPAHVAAQVRRALGLG